MADEPLDLAKLKSDLKREGAPWEMDVTAMTALTEEERRIRLGVTPPPGELSLEDVDRAVREGSAPAVEPAESVGAPAAFDLRNVGGRNFVTPIKNQGGCGSCVAFGAAAAIETTARWERGDPNLAIDLSEAQLFYCHARSEGRNCSNGWWPDNAYTHCKNTGVTFEDYYPYTAADQNCTALNADWPNRLAKISSFEKIPSPAAMKEWLSTRGALSACLAVYQDFFSYRSGVYRHVSGALAGGHCVTLIGYDDAQGCWIGKNSWGTGWGDGGFFRIAYGECGIETWLGPNGVRGVTLRLWQNNMQVRGLWTNNADRNAWVYLTGAGWRKIAPDSDQVTATMLAQLVSAKAGARPVNVFEDAGTIKQLYVV